MVKIILQANTVTLDHLEHPNTAGTDPFYNKDVLVGTVTTNTITVNVGISSNTSEHRFVSALTGAIEMTGAKRLIKNDPTVVNMSWGYGTYFSGIIGGNYRGTAWRYYDTY